jgi:hypothetical protein
LLLLYFSCHGVKDPTGRLYFAATNTRFGRLGSTGISAAWVNEQVDRSRSRRIVLLLDCCYSGAFARGLAPRAAPGMQVMEQLDGRGRAVITASDAMEYAYEGDELALDAGQPSVFTRALVEGLETGEADRDRDGRVAIDELYAYLYERVRQTTPTQTPTISTIGLQGELYLARNPNPPPPPVKPAPLPFELRQAVESEIAWQRSGAVAGLSRLAAGARPELVLTATQALQKLAADEDDDVRTGASVALQRLAGGEKPQAGEDQRTRKVDDHRRPELLPEPGRNSHIDARDGRVEPSTPRDGAGTLLTWLAVAGTALVLVWGILVSRGWHSELSAIRVGVGVLLAMLAVGGLWKRQWKWVLAAGLSGVIGLALWMLQLLSTGHTVPDLLSPATDGIPNIITWIGALLVLIAGAMGTRARTTRQ